MNFALRTSGLLSSSTGVAMAIYEFFVLALVCSVSEVFPSVSGPFLSKKAAAISYLLNHLDPICLAESLL